MKSWGFHFFLVLFFFSNLASRGQTLEEALDATNLTWTTSENAPWRGQTSITHDGISAAGTGNLSAGWPPYVLQTTATGPGTLTFWWKLSLSPFGSLGTELSLSANGIVLTNIQDVSDWKQQTIYLGEGNQTLEWVYSIYAPSSSGSGAWLDEVSFVPGATAPILLSQPRSQSQVKGLDARFSVWAGGTPPLFYQWQFSGSNIAGATNLFLVISNIQAADLGDYRVVVSNSVDVLVSSNATLEFGEVTAWGDNTYDQVTVPPGMTNVMAIGAGFYHGAVLRKDGSVFVWGRNDLGQTNVPAGLSNVWSIAAGNDHSLALKSDGKPVVWQLNSVGQTNIPSTATNVVMVAPGSSSRHGLALRATGTVVAWGNNVFQQTNVPSGLTNVVAVAAGQFHSLALTSGGKVVAWGNNGFGQTNVPATLTNAIAIAAGALHNLAIKPDGTVVSWGDLLGRTNMPVDLTNVVAIAAGSRHSLALRADGTVAAWGTDFADMGYTNVPVGLTNVVAIAAGGLYSMAWVGEGPPAQVADALDPVRFGNHFSFSIPTPSGYVFMPEYKNTLVTPTWTPSPLLAGNGGWRTITDSNAIAPQRFYRVRRW